MAVWLYVMCMRMSRVVVVALSSMMLSCLEPAPEPSDDAGAPPPMPAVAAELAGVVGAHTPMRVWEAAAPTAAARVAEGAPSTTRGLAAAVPTAAARVAAELSLTVVGETAGPERDCGFSAFSRLLRFSHRLSA